MPARVQKDCKKKVSVLTLARPVESEESEEACSNFGIRDSSTTLAHVTQHCSFVNRHLLPATKEDHSSME